MKGRTIALDELDGTEAAALIVDGQLHDLLIDSDHPRPGTIYRAVALRPVKGQGGMFLRTPDGNAFLRQVKGLAPGDALLVQVTGFAEPGKAIPVTTRLLFKSRYAIVTPGAPGINVSRQIKDDDLRDTLLGVAHEVMEGDHGLILRSSCEGAADDAVAEDILAMAQLATAVLADATGGAELLVDLELSYKVSDMLKLAVGGENIFDNYPDVEARQSQINNGIRYLRFAPTGFNGGFWYVRATASF